MRINFPAISVITHCPPSTTDGQLAINTRVGEWRRPRIIFGMCLNICGGDGGEGFKNKCPPGMETDGLDDDDDELDVVVGRR